MAAPRSPRYPNISLNEAMARAKAIYEKEHMSTMTPTVAAEAMGYKGISGASLKTISSLKKYGLLDGRGDDVRLTKDAQTLAIDDPSSDDYQDALARAAFAPEIFQEIRKQFPGVASERNISVYLEKQGFRSDAALTVAKYYKDSLALVGEGPASYSGSDNAEPPMKSAVESARPRAPVRFFGGGDAISFLPTGGRYEQETRPVGDAAAPYRITMNGTKLHIEADVDLAGLQTLKKMLEGYEKILTLLGTAVDQIARPEWADKAYKSGETVPVDGIWAVTHQGHAGVAAQEYRKGQRFMSCDECEDRNAVRYTYAHPIAE